MIVSTTIQTKCQKIKFLCLFIMQNKSINKIAVIGCGWLGLPLAKQLQDLGYLINGSTTNESKLSVLADYQINPFLIKLGDEVDATQLQKFLKVDLLIVNVPPGRASSTADLYVEKMILLKNAVLKSTVQKIIFVSSTSVYAEDNTTHTESSQAFSTEGNATRLLDAEKTFLNLPNIETTIIRMSGLIGPQRHPGRFFAGKSDIPAGLAPVNLIHLEDCIGIIAKVIEANLWNDVYNGAAPTHPTRKDFYDWASFSLYGKHAEFIPEKGKFKIIDGSKIMEKGYQFKHPDLIGWLKQAHQN